MRKSFGFSRIFLGLLSIVLIAFLLASTDFAQVWSTLSQARLELVGAALVAAFFSVFVKTLRWRVLLQEKKKIDVKKLFLVQASGLAVSNLSPGKILEPFKVIPLNGAGVSYGFLVSSVFWERAMDLILLFALALGSLAFLDSNAGLFLQAGFVLLLATIVVMFRNSRKALELASKFPFLNFLEKAEAHDFRKRSLLAAMVLTLLAWTGDFTAIFFSFLSLGMEIDFLGLASAFSISVLAGIISFLPGGVGSTEAVFAIMLSAAPYALPKIVAGVFLSRITTILFTTLLGLALLPMVRKQD